MNLESVLRDPRYASTTFVMIHGGYPLEREAIWLAAMKNVYLDSSVELGAVSFGLQRHAEDVAGNFSRQDHLWHRLFPLQSGVGRGRKLLAGRAVVAHGAWPRLWPR